MMIFVIYEKLVLEIDIWNWRLVSEIWKFYFIWTFDETLLLNTL